MHFVTESGSIRRHQIGIALLIVAVVFGVAYRQTLSTIVSMWSHDDAYSHGFLVLPISLWIAWKKWPELTADWVRLSAVGFLLLALCVLGWVLASTADVKVVAQLMVVSMVAAAVLALCGWRIFRILAFPLGFLFFAVPFGRGLVPVLMQLTADISTWLLRLTGVPVHRSHMLISIPAGDFEVARACSGLNYFVTGIVLGLVYSYLTYRSTRKRLISVAAFIIFPILANGVRVYLTILSAHLTDMRFGPGHEHIVFGRILFVVAISLMFWLGLRWRDPDPLTSTAKGQSVAAGTGVPRSWWGAWLAAMLLIVAGPWLNSSLAGRAQAALPEAAKIVRLPQPAQGWQGPKGSSTEWRPAYSGSVGESVASYSRASDGAAVDVFVAGYGLGKTSGSEMISYGNQITRREIKTLSPQQDVQVRLASAKPLPVIEQVVDGLEERRLVWHWFLVGRRPTTNPYEVKVLETVAIVTGNANSERVVVLSTPDSPTARALLQDFVRAHESCVADGFVGARCRP